jgi:hypothetical protein
MDITKFSEDDLKEIEERRKALEAIEQGDLGKVTKLKTITDTNKKLMDLFNAPEKYAVKDNESDFKKVKDILEERK